MTMTFYTHQPAADIYATMQASIGNDAEAMLYNFIPHEKPELSQDFDHYANNVEQFLLLVDKLELTQDLARYANKELFLYVEEIPYKFNEDNLKSNFVVVEINDDQSALFSSDILLEIGRQDSDKIMMIYDFPSANVETIEVNSGDLIEDWDGDYLTQYLKSRGELSTQNDGALLTLGFTDQNGRDISRKFTVYSEQEGLANLLKSMPRDTQLAELDRDTHTLNHEDLKQAYSKYGINVVHLKDNKLSEYASLMDVLKTGGAVTLENGCELKSDVIHGFIDAYGPNDEFLGLHTLNEVGLKMAMKDIYELDPDNNLRP